MKAQLEELGWRRVTPPAAAATARRETPSPARPSPAARPSPQPPAKVEPTPGQKYESKCSNTVSGVAEQIYSTGTSYIFIFTVIVHMYP